MHVSRGLVCLFQHLPPTVGLLQCAYALRLATGDVTARQHAGQDSTVLLSVTLGCLFLGEVGVE